MSEFKIKATERWKNRYSYAYKIEIIEQIENGQLSQNQASIRYGVHRKTISGWLKKYGNLEKNLKEMGGKSPAQEIAELRAKLRVLENEKEVWRFIFDVIEDEYGEDAVKKYMPLIEKQYPRVPRQHPGGPAQGYPEFPCYVFLLFCLILHYSCLLPFLPGH